MKSAFHNKKEKNVGKDKVQVKQKQSYYIHFRNFFSFK